MYKGHRDEFYIVRKTREEKQPFAFSHSREVTRHAHLLIYILYGNMCLGNINIEISHNLGHRVEILLYMHKRFVIQTDFIRSAINLMPKSDQFIRRINSQITHLLRVISRNGKAPLNADVYHLWIEHV